MPLTMPLKALMNAWTWAERNGICMLEFLIKPFDGFPVKGKTQTHSYSPFNRYDLI
jgi:hypothetical protein